MFTLSSLIAASDIIQTTVSQAAPEPSLQFKLSIIDILILIGTILFNLGVGAYFARRQTGTGTYFLGGGSMPGWLVGFSITASMISAMTFLGLPGFTFKENWFWVLPSFSFLILGILSAYFIVPFFRKVNTPSGYAYLEQRYGTWARIYAAVGFLAFILIRLGVVLYVTCIALEEFLGIPTIVLILILGLVATIYTMFGGFESVIWTDFFQAMLLIVAGGMLLPMILLHIDGDWFGLSTVFSKAYEAGKLSLGNTHFTFAEKTLWVALISTLFMDASNFSTRQDLIQRYRAPKDLFNARTALIIAGCTVVPIWIYFNFLGTSLWAYYEINPDVVVNSFRDTAPEKIVPYFMATHLPWGLKGLFLAVILSASLNALAPLLNACTVTWVGDFYQRFLAKHKSDRHYMNVGKVSTGIVGVFMMTSALLIYASRSQTLQNLQQTFAMICSMGLFGLFMVGFFSKRVGNRAAKLSAAIVVPLGLIWALLFFIKTSPGFAEGFGNWMYKMFYAGGDTTLAQVVEKAAHWQSAAGEWVPEIFWLVVIMNLLMIFLSLLFATFLPNEKRDLKNLTIYTIEDKHM